MNSVSIVSIGDELLVGQVTNTNAAWIGEQLTAIGWNVQTIVTIGDDRNTIARIIAQQAKGSDVVITSGGLGPTHDDLTREAVCDLLGCGMEIDTDQLNRIERRFHERGIVANERSRMQALVPSACRRLANEYGSAPGLSFVIENATVYVLPGVPAELRGIMSDSIVAELRSRGADTDRRTFLLFGVTESALADSLVDTERLLDDRVTLAFLPSAGGIRLRAMRLSGEADVVQRYTTLVSTVRTRCEPWLVSEHDEPLAQCVGRVFVERGLTLATAESCTGGLVGSQVTSIPGSSQWFRGGIVAYSNDLKVNLLGVDRASIERHGAASDEVARGMAEGGRKATGADIVVAVTGIAGPDGGTPSKPVGTVFIAIATRDGVQASRHQFGRGREQVRERTAATALDLARRAALALR